MRASIALQRYLQRHIEAGLPHHSFTAQQWHHVLVIPCYREAPTLLQKLAALPAGNGLTLVILVLNRPDSDSDTLANNELRSALQGALLRREERSTVPVHSLNRHTDLYLLDLESLCGPTPAARGVGLVRKTGCDLALQWMEAGGISSQWLCSTDADATVPPDYFKQLHSAPPDAVAAVFPFRHVPGGDEVCDTATAVYETRLHHYVLGLAYAGSPYAFHTLGSCLAIKASAYAQVRGYPKRSGAEDFYLLNKVAKLGPVARLQGQCVELQSRRSSRVPFGTGPAVAAIIAYGQPQAAAIFYHPQCFVALKVLLDNLPELAHVPEQDIAQLLIRQGLDQTLAAQSQLALAAQGIAASLAHCQRQSKSSAQFLRQFHQWFDGFRTLKFIHALRDAGWQQQSLAQLDGLQPALWPIAATPPHAIETLRAACARDWGWHFANATQLR